MCIIIFRRWIKTLKQKSLNFKNRNKKYDTIEFIDTPFDFFKFSVNYESEIINYKICDSDDEYSDSDCELEY